MTDIETVCRKLALDLVAQASVTGSTGEAEFGPWLAGYLRSHIGFGAKPDVWTFPVAPGDARHVVALLIRGSGARTVVLTG